MLVEEVASLKVLLACLLVSVNPVVWNFIARLEYRTRVVSRLCGGPRAGVVILGGFIMFMNFLRTSLFRYVVADKPKVEYLDEVWMKVGGYLIIGVGAVLVLSSYWKLGFYNTFLGDYFGILMDTRVTGFPFNVMNDPMYCGASIIYVGDALSLANPVGLLLSLFISLSYAIAAVVEGPFTTKIYAEKALKSL